MNSGMYIYLKYTTNVNDIINTVNLFDVEANVISDERMNKKQATPF